MTDTFRDLIIRTSKDKEEAEFRIALHEALAEFAFDKNEEGKMVDDLVKRLRKNVMCGDAAIEEAADRIEHLENRCANLLVGNRALNIRSDKLETALREIAWIATPDHEEMRHKATEIARKALEGKDD